MECSAYRTSLNVILPSAEETINGQLTLNLFNRILSLTNILPIKPNSNRNYFSKNLSRLCWQDKALFWIKESLVDSIEKPKEDKAQFFQRVGMSGDDAFILPPQVI